jgi:hypothetical protein
MNVRIPHFFSSEEIAIVMNDPTIALHKDKLSEKQMVHFSITLPDTIQSKLKKIMNVSQRTIPMTWVRGDTVEHIDQGTSAFDHTYFIYLTNSPGKFLVDGQSYSIQAGSAHIFSEGLTHSTLNTEDRLIMGPMSETGLPVGIPITNSIYYYPSDTFTDVYMVFTSYTQQAIILNIPPPVPEGTSDYSINYVNESGLTIWSPPPGKRFGGWRLMNSPDNVPIGNNTVDKIYIPGEIFEYTTSTNLVPYWIDLPRFRLHFNDNSIVFYKPNSLSSGAGGVRNYRAKQRKT